MTDCGCTNFPASLGNVTFGASVGIGTSAPVAALDVNNGAAPQLVVRGGATSTIRVFPAPGNAIASIEAFTAADSIPDPTNFSRLRLTIDGQTAGVVADAAGTGTPLLVAFSAGGAERLRIDTAGNVGIGTSSPQRQLSVNGTANLDQADANNGVADLTFGSGSGEGIGSKRTTGGNQAGLDFYTGFQPRLSITIGGNVGVGTTSPGYPLDITGAVRTTDAYLVGSRTVADLNGCYYA